MSSTKGFPRKEVFIPSHGVEMAGWVYPASTSSSGQPGPAIVLGHGLGAVKEMGLDKYAELFSQNGYLSVAFDYRGFGGSRGGKRQILDWNMQQADWDEALKFTRALPEVDPDQIGVFGTSFGGGHVIAVAARDKRIKAAISQCPFTSGPHSALTIGLSVIPKLLYVGLKDYCFGSGTQHGQMVPVPLFALPGEVGLMNAEDVEPGILRLVPKEMMDTLPRVVAGKAALQIPFLFPGSYAKNVDCPIYFGICAQDSVAPPEPTIGYAKTARRGTYKVYEGLSHFTIYVDEGFKRASADYLSFLKDVMPV